MSIKCERCSEQFPENDIYQYRGQNLCEDCLMGAMEAPKTCDVTATQLATKHRQATGQKGTDGLLDIQKKIYEYIKENEKVTRQQVMDALDIPDWELEKQIAVLRHCELVKGRKEEGGVYLVTFDY